MMSGAEFSLLAVTIGFTGLVWWVYAPKRRSRLEAHGSIPLNDIDQPPRDPAPTGGRQP